MIQSKNSSFKHKFPFIMKIGILILIFGTITMNFASQDFTSNLDIDCTNTSENTLFHNINPKASIVHGKIFIDGDDGANDWGTFPNKTGSGTFADPYIIENLEIDAGSTGSGIHIQDSYVYAEIFDCTVSNSGSYIDAGIMLNNCSNIKLINCTSEYNGNNGIYITDNSYNNTFSGNNVSYNNCGILMSYSNNNTLSENIVSYNTFDGILLWNSNNSILDGNNANKNTDDGISLCNSNNSTLSGNIVSCNDGGIILYTSNNNTLSENNANYNTNYGILMSYSNNNTLSENEVSYNNSGFRLGTSNNNTLSENNASYNVNGYILSNLNNSILSRNNASYNTNHGISLYTSNNNTLSENNANYNTYDGISLSTSNNNTLSGNNVSYNIQDGIDLSASNNNTLSGNNINYNIQDGIDLSASNNNTLSGNNASYNTHHGILLEKSSRNVVQNNMILENFNTGIYMSSSNENVIRNNLIENNEGYGIFLYYNCSDNEIYENDLYANKIPQISDKNGNSNQIYNNNIKMSFTQWITIIGIGIGSIVIIGGSILRIIHVKKRKRKSKGEQTDIMEKTVKTEEIKPIPEKKPPTTSIKEDMDLEYIQVNQLINEGSFAQAITTLKSMIEKTKNIRNLKNLNKKIVKRLEFAENTMYFQNKKSELWKEYKSGHNLQETYYKFKVIIEELAKISHKAEIIQLVVVKEVNNAFKIIEEKFKKELSENRASIEENIIKASGLLNPESISQVVEIIREQQKNAEKLQFTDLFPRLTEKLDEVENIQKIFDVFKRTKRMSIADISKRVKMPREELIDFVFDPAKGLHMLEIDGDYLILKQEKEQKKAIISKPPISIPQTFSEQNVKIFRGGDWKIEGNLSVFHYKVKVLNSSGFVITQIQILLTGLPKGLEIEKDRYRIESLKPQAYESPTFRLKAKESCVGDIIEGIVIYNSPTGKQITTNINPFKISYVCNLLVPKLVSKQEFDQKTEFMNEKRLTIESDLEVSELERKIENIVRHCNFALLQQLNQEKSNEYKKLEAFAEGLYDKQDVGLSVALKKMENGSQLMIKAMSDRTDKLTDLMRDFNTKLDDIKSDTELIKEYTSQIEDLFDQVVDLEFFLKDKLQSDFEKIRETWHAYKDGLISRKQLIGEGIKVMGKKFIKLLVESAVSFI